MDRRGLLTAGMATLAASALPAHAHSDDHQDIVGSWLGTVTATDPPLGQFNDLISFHEGGVVTESRRYFVPVTPLGKLLETTGHGVWERGRGRSFDAFFRFLLQHAETGEPLGTDNVRLSLALVRSTGKLDGTFESQIKDDAGNVIVTVTGTFSATRITV